MVLPYQDLLIEAIPSAGPVFVCPANAKRQINIRILKQLLQRPVKQTSASKPIMMETEPRDSVVPSQFGLPPHHTRHAKVIEAEFSGQPRLIMAYELRGGLGYIGPLGEASTPPFIVFANRVELWQIESNCAYINFRKISRFFIPRHIVVVAPPTGHRVQRTQKLSRPAPIRDTIVHL